MLVVQEYFSCDILSHFKILPYLKLLLEDNFLWLGYVSSAIATTRKLTHSHRGPGVSPLQERIK